MLIPAAVATAAAPTTAAATLTRLRFRARPVTLSVTLLASAAAWPRTRATFFRACLTAGFLASCVASSSPFRFACEITVFARPTAWTAFSLTFAIFRCPPSPVVRVGALPRTHVQRGSHHSTSTEGSSADLSLEDQFASEWLRHRHRLFQR